MAIREAVQIIIDRLTTHPEDFQFNGRLNWVRDFLRNAGYDGSTLTDMGLTEEECTALRTGFQAFDYNVFHTKVLDSLLQEVPEPMQGGAMFNKRYLTPKNSLITANNLSVGALRVLEDQYSGGFADPRATYGSPKV